MFVVLKVLEQSGALDMLEDMLECALEDGAAGVFCHAGVHR